MATVKRLLIGFLALALGAAAPVFAQEPAEAPAPARPSLLPETDNPFAALVGKRRESPSEGVQARRVERYVLATDDRIFLFEERGGTARVRFLCSPEDARIDCVLDAAGPAPEIYRLTATRGPRGDVIYKTAEGDTMLRIAAYGGATVYWPGEQQGVAASKSFGDDHALTLAPLSYSAAQSRAQGASAQISAIVGAPIFFDTTPSRGAQAFSSRNDNAAVLADAVLTVAKGIASVADDATGARIIAERIKRVSFVPAKSPSVSLDEAVLRIGYVPNQDIDGRPSSLAVAHYLEETL